jgi:hypothetical protein
MAVADVHPSAEELTAFIRGTAWFKSSRFWVTLRTIDGRTS